MPKSITEFKTILRRQCRQTRQALAEDYRAQASTEICRKIAAWSEFKSAQVILTYMPIKAEVDLRPLLMEQPHKIWVLPRIVPESEHSMTLHPYIPQKLVQHPYGMLEPAADLPIVEPREIELALLPGLAYSPLGWRLGYGGGYYDRFLKYFTGISLGVTYDILLIDQIPHDTHDLPVRWIVTETRLFKAPA